MKRKRGRRKDEREEYRSDQTKYWQSPLGRLLQKWQILGSRLRHRRLGHRINESCRSARRPDHSDRTTNSRNGPCQQVRFDHRDDTDTVVSLRQSRADIAERIWRVAPESVRIAPPSGVADLRQNKQNFRVIPPSLPLRQRLRRAKSHCLPDFAQYYPVRTVVWQQESAACESV